MVRITMSPTTCFNLKIDFFFKKVNACLKDSFIFQYPNDKLQILSDQIIISGFQKAAIGEINRRIFYGG